MQICHVNISRAFSGGERQTLNLIEALAAGTDCTQMLICQPDSKMMETVRHLPVEVQSVRHPLAGHRRRTYPEDSLLHAHCGQSVHWCGAEHWLRGSRYLVTRRVDNPLSGKPTTRYSYGHASKIVCLSRAIQEGVHRLLPEAPTMVIPSSYSSFPSDPDTVAAIRRRFAGKFLFGQVGKLIPHKGFHVTLEAARQLAADHPQLQVAVVGDGPERQRLQQQARGLPNVSFLGYQEKVGSYYAALDGLLFPSLSEGLGSGILEAWQHGVPVIASQAGGIPDLIRNEENGLLVPPGEPQALAAAMVRLAGQPQLRRRLAREAADSLQDYSAAAVASRYLDLYRSILDEPAR